MPQQMVTEFIQLVKDLVFVRQGATCFTVPNAESSGVPALDVDPSDSDWTTELSVGNEEGTANFGKREFRPHPLAKYIKESKKLMRQVPNVETVLLDRLGYKMSITQEKAFISGDGSDKPLGVFTASANGISTNRDTISAGSNAIVGDDVINTFYALKAPYRAKAQWLLSRSIVLAVRKLKDNNNNYLWTAGYGNPTGAQSGPGGGLQGTPDTLMGRPIGNWNTRPARLRPATTRCWSATFRATGSRTALQCRYKLCTSCSRCRIRWATSCAWKATGCPSLRKRSRGCASCNFVPKRV